MSNQFISSFLNLTVRLSVCLSGCLSVCPSIGLCARQTVHPFNERRNERTEGGTSGSLLDGRRADGLTGRPRTDEEPDGPTDIDGWTK